MDTAFPAELQRRLEEMLLGGALPRGTAVDAAELADHLEASPDDLDRVLASAERKGLVERVSPSGSSFRILGLADTDFVSVFTHTERSGLKPRSLVRQVEVQPAGDDVARCLEVPFGSPVYRYVRTRYVEEEPLANQINYMPYEVCPGLEHDDVSRYSFQKLLEGKYHTVLASAREQILLVPATEEDRQILGLPPGSSILLIDRIALSPTGRPVVWATIRIRPDRIQSVAALWPEAAIACGELAQP